jgi:transcriptional regulator with XRE-family HTH domain
MAQEVSGLPGGTGGKGGKPPESDGFAARLSAHLDAGTRPGLKPGAVGGKWTAPAFGRATGVSERTVRNWRNANTLPEPETLPFLLDALFGTEPGLAAQRRALEDAWDAAQWRKASETLAAATPEPDAVQFIERDGRLVLAPAPASDHAAAQLPAVLQRHPLLLEKLDDLLEAIGNRLDNQPAWRPLPRMAQRLRVALDHPVADLPDRLAEIYDRTIALASFVELDDALAGDAAATDSPLDPSFRRPLTDFLATAAPWLRSFPSVLAADSARDDMLKRPELFATIRPRLADARALIQAAAETGVLSAEDAARVEEPLLTAERAGFQAEKAGYRGLANARSLLTASARVVAFTSTTVFLGAVGSDVATKSALVPLVGDMWRRVEAPALRLASDLPGDLAAASRYVIRYRESFLLKALTPLADLAPLPSPPLRRDPPDMEEVKRMILAGAAPPPEWVPFITQLTFKDEKELKDLAPLAGLTSLLALNLEGTGATELFPLAGLTSLETLDLDQTGVTELAPVAGLTSLQGLYLNQTGVTELAPLAGLTNLLGLMLDGTGVTELAPLAGLTSLQGLYLNQTGVTELAPLAGLTSLQRLSLNQTGVTELAPLAGLTSLQRLSLDLTGVTDLAPLAGLTSLQTLLLNMTGVTDLAPLAGLPNLTVQINGHELRPAQGQTQVPAGVRGRPPSPAGGSGGSAP